MRRLLGAAAGVLCSLTAASAQTTSGLSPHESEPAQDYRLEFTQRYCVGCHGKSEPKADFRIDALSYDLAQDESRERWLEVLDYVEHGDMPPSSAELLPQEQEVARFLAVLEADLQAASVGPPVGVAALRRMTRFEHLHTLNDLFGIRGLQLPGSFPEDVSSYQFDTMAEGLYSSAAHLDASLELAAEVADRILPLTPSEPTRVVIERDDWGKGWTKKGDPRAFYFTGINNSERGGALSGKAFTAPTPGVYEVHLRGSAEGLVGSDGKPLRLGFYVLDRSRYTYPAREDRSRLLRVAELEVRNLQPEELTCEITLEKGESFQIYCENRIPERYPARGILRDELFALTRAAKASPKPTVRIESLAVAGPIRPLPRQARFLQGQGAVAEEGYVKSVLVPLAERAYRRPLTTSEEDELVRPVMQHLAEAAAPRYGIHFGIRRILAAPQFLLLNDEPDSRNAFGLASRLSYFLWSSLPDEELVRLAQDDRLTDLTILRDQVLRMIQDPRASRFVESFTGQWLSNREAATVMVCDVRHVWSELIRYGYLRSTEMFFAEILEQNHSIRNFIDSDFTYANEPMRIAWEFPGEHPPWDELEDRQIQSSNWPEPERLDLTSLAPGVPDHVAARGGVLGLPSMLLATSDGVESSPILRGVWILENVLGTPTPPPPDDVPALVPDLTQARTVREVLAAHQASESCARCHVKIDPLGLAMEHYDATGDWRSEYSVKSIDSEGNDRFTPMPLETAAVLSDGTRIEGPADIKAYLLRNPAMFTRCLGTKLVEYALGRELSAADTRVLEEIVLAEPAEGYGFQDLIVAIVLSEVFLARER